MTVDPESMDAESDTVGTVQENLEEYIDVLEAERDFARGLLDDLDSCPDDEALTREEVEDLLPEETPLEAIGGAGI